MSKFLKLKEDGGKRVLVAVGAVISVRELESGCEVQTRDDVITVKEGYQTLVNRLTKGDGPAEAEQAEA